jgi:hypothetical protein
LILKRLFGAAITFRASPGRHEVRRGEKPPRVIAATPVTPAAFCIADDFGLIRAWKNAAAGPGRRVFYSRPGRELGQVFFSVARKTRT